jgi:hypothetical protein
VLNNSTKALDMKQVDFPDRANTGDPNKFGNGVAPPPAPPQGTGGSCVLGVIGPGCDNNNGGGTGNQNNGGQNGGGGTGNQNNGGQNGGGGTGNQNNGGQNGGGTGNQNNDVTVLPGQGGTNGDNGG